MNIHGEVLHRLESGESEQLDLIVYIDCLNRMRNFPFHRVTVKDTFPFIGAMSLTCPVSAVKNLAHTSGVQYVTAETIATVKMDVAAKTVLSETGGFSEFRGKGVHLAVLDTGIDPHLDFCVPQNRIVHFEDVLHGGSSPYDDNGHGTAVTGAAAGNGLVSGGRFRGIAPECGIVMVKCMDAAGISTAGNVLKAMQWVADYGAKYHISVVCMSLGAQDLGEHDPFRVAAAALWNRGFTVVAAAGNGGKESGSIKSPGTAARIITCGSYDDKRTAAFDDDEIPAFSGRGPVQRLIKPDFTTPGVGIRCTADFTKTGKHYTEMSGTSISTGIAAGACCLVHQRYPQATNDDVKTYLMRHARKISGDRNSEGSGALRL